MNSFIPTYLYIKQHNKTKLKYFGKTTYDPKSYPGSGIHWRRHLRKHGNDVSTIWSRLFSNPEELTEYALNFSKIHNIVESPDWANLINENGFDGAPKGNKFSAITTDRMKAAWTPERRKEQSKRTSIQNRMREKVTCPHCGKEGTGIGSMNRFHFSNCSLIKPRKLKKDEPRKKSSKNIVEWTFLSPTNEKVVVSNLRQFCRDNILNIGSMSEVGNGNRKSHKKWRLFSTKTDDGTYREI